MSFGWGLDALIAGILLFLLITIWLVSRQSVGRSDADLELEAPEPPRGGLFPRRLIRQSGSVLRSRSPWRSRRSCCGPSSGRAV